MSGSTSTLVTARRYARRASVERIVLAHASASALEGVHTKIRARLAPAPGPLGLWGPLISRLRRYAPRRVSGIFTPAGNGRSKGRRGVSSSADTLLRNVTTTSRAPAFTGTRTFHDSSARLRAARSRAPTRTACRIWEIGGRVGFAWLSGMGAGVASG